MTAVALFLLQTTAPAAPAAAVKPPALEVAKPCQPSKNGDIVVCARPDERSPYRLPLPVGPEQGPRTLAFKLPSNINGDVHLEQHGRQGIPDHRIMVHLTKRF